MPTDEPRLRVHVDVTSTLRSGWRAGIQRAVCQLLAHLPDADPRLEVVPMAWCQELGGFRRLTADEHADLLASTTPTATPGVGPVVLPAVPPASAPTGVADRLRARARGAGVRVLERAGVAGALRTVRDRARWRRDAERFAPLLLGELPPGSVLLELDAVWNVTQVDRPWLYERLRERGVGVAAMVYDVLPLERPEWFVPPLVAVFRRAVLAQAAGADLLLTNSEATARSLVVRVAAEGGLEAPPVAVVPLGGDAVGAGAPGPGSGRDELPTELAGGRFVLVVGTVEPRKNQAVILDAFEALVDSHPDLHLVLVGRQGWDVGDVVQRLADHDLSGSRLHWVRDADDHQLAVLYRHAKVVAVPSHAEGFGLPVVEALRHGCPVVCSTAGALREVGGEAADYVGRDDVEGWVEALGRHLDDPEHHAWALRRAAAYQVPTWAGSAAAVARVLLERFGRGAGAPGIGGRAA